MKFFSTVVRERKYKLPRTLNKNKNTRTESVPENLKSTIFNSELILTNKKIPLNTIPNYRNFECERKALREKIC